MKRRFIAGAVCPECSAVDRIVIEGEGESRTRTCVACGFSDASSAEPLDRSTAGRFDRRRVEDREAGSTEAQPVRFIDPKSPPHPR